MDLKQYLFDGLTNLNTGFDVPSIIYVSEQDFETLLNRAEQKNVSIYGIEPWLNGDFYDVKAHENYNLSADDPSWYKTVFSEFKAQNPNLQYAISFG